ncbi:hypothetical protein BCR35DRAFT_334031 [Leucosporidium creatinivorum]|uniref:Uncharacterized protein n=1 Tax=Leucosporidium creatinivorum TaxID=106004 RepID=A0A1Y2EME7_9BASI|nr:hypothetical protein BCR35DRAFT_334031 [Leucosporidium creatinivorum]
MAPISQLLFSLLSFVFLATAAPLGTPRVKPTTLTANARASSSTAAQFAQIGTPRVSPKPSSSSLASSTTTVAAPTTNTASYPGANQPKCAADSYNYPLNNYACRLCTDGWGEGVDTCWQFGVITCKPGYKPVASQFTTYGCKKT